MSSKKPKFNFGDTIVIASHNKGKINEFSQLLSAYNIKILTSLALNISDVNETGKSFKENSIIKVNSVSNKHLVISDDSGLCINSLDNRPGIYSSRFSKESGGWINAMEKIYKEILDKDSNDFSAKFVCSLSIKFPSSEIFSYSGEVHGKIVWPPKGENGFGYDPFFIPSGSEKTFAEMNHKEKILIDHRNVALKKLLRSHLNGN